MPKNKKDVVSNEVADWYAKIPETFKTKYHNPCYDNHLLTLPFFMGIIGQTGSGKSTLVLDLVSRCKDTFGNITIVTANADEPLYNFLRSKIPSEALQIFEGIQNVPQLDSLDPDVQHLVVFDDLCLEHNQNNITEYFIRGRKIAKGVSCCYLSQSYFKIPKTIRLQCGYFILKKLSSITDVNMIMRDFALGCKKEELVEMYKACTQDPKDFLMIDIKADASKKFRYNWLEHIEF